MRWDRIPTLAAQWHVHVIDTTGKGLEQVAATALTWIRSAIGGNEQTLHITDPHRPTSLT
jgi:hypothetical protein